MSSRYSLVAKAEEIANRFAIEVADYYRPIYNAAPSQLLPVITSENPNGLSTFYWGQSPTLSKNKNVSERIINMRSEQVLEKPILRNAIRTRRCIIPADGFYEWKKIGKKIAIPYRFIRKDKNLFAFAGAWEEFDDVSGERFHTFSIFTTMANKLVSTIHERMPAILTPTAEKIWLGKTEDEELLASLLQPLPENLMDMYTVSARINSEKNNDASLVLPAPAQDQHGNLTLFD